MLPDGARFRGWHNDQDHECSARAAGEAATEGKGPARAGRFVAAQLVDQLKLKMVAAQKLRAAIASLRPTAKIDAAAPEAKTDAVAPPEASSSSSSAPADELCEAVVVCIDRSGSMGTPLAEKTINEVTFESRAPVMQRTRMEGVKAMFYAFRDATETVGGGTHKLALLSFDNEVETRLGLTSRLADFEAIVDDIERRGQTAIFSSVVEGGRPRPRGEPRRVAAGRAAGVERRDAGHGAAADEGDGKRGGGRRPRVAAHR